MQTSSFFFFSGFAGDGSCGAPLFSELVGGAFVARRCKVCSASLLASSSALCLSLSLCFFADWRGALLCGSLIHSYLSLLFSQSSFSRLSGFLYVSVPLFLSLFLFYFLLLRVSRFVSFLSLSLSFFFSPSCHVCVVISC